MGSAYERELKGILAGEAAVIEKASKSMEPDEVKNYHRPLTHPFLMVRGAGSLGVDLVALRGDVAFPIEVKSARKDTLHFSHSSGANQDQAEEMIAECRRAGVVPIYAFRLKRHLGDAWRIFSLPVDGLTGRGAVLHERLPQPERGASGSFILRWNDGMPLNKLLNYLCR